MYEVFLLLLKVPSPCANMALAMGNDMDEYTLHVVDGVHVIATQKSPNVQYSKFSQSQQREVLFRLYMINVSI